MRSGPLIASCFLHALILAAFLVVLKRQHHEEYVPPASVAVVFQSGGEAKTAAPKTAKRGPPEDQMSPRLPTPLAPNPSRPTITALSPPTPMPQTVLRQPEHIQQPLLRSRPTARPLHKPTPNRHLPPLPNYIAMNNMSYGSPPHALVLHPGHGLQLAPSESDLRNAFSQDFKILGKIGPDWSAELTRWVDERKYYPERAVALGQQGSVMIRLVIERNGKVKKVTLVRSSGSPYLDSAWTGLFEGSRVPPFPPGTKADQITIDATMHYILIN